jgi:predicted nuclease of predicted toxin-antitoxin system
MTFFFDENFPKTVAKILNSKGHEIIDIRSTELEGADDISIFKMAQEKKAIFLTTDRDFFHTIPHLFEKHHGIIVIAVRSPNRSSISEKLFFALDHFDLSNFESKVLLLRDKHYTLV